VREGLLGFLIELEVAIFERMVDDLAGFVMLDLDRRLGTCACRKSNPDMLVV
jgi:hypothetical protein